MPSGWEDNHRSDTELATCQTLVVLETYIRKGDEYPKSLVKHSELYLNISILTTGPLKMVVEAQLKGSVKEPNKVPHL